MTIAEARERTHAEHQHPALVADIARVRALLEAYRDGLPAPVPPAGGDSDAVEQVVSIFGLSPFERDLLLLAAAVELDGDVAALVAAAGGSDPRPTFAHALAALPDAHWDAISPSAPLRRWRMLDLGTGHTIASRPLRIDERVLQHLIGIPALDERLDGLLSVVGGRCAIAPTHRDLAADIARVALATSAASVVTLDGDDVAARMAVAREVALHVDLLPLVVRGAALPPPGQTLSDVALLVDREVALLGGLVIVDAADAPVPVVAALLDMLLAPLVAVLDGHAGAVKGRVRLHRGVALPTPAEQRELWQHALGTDLAEELAATVEGVAQHYRLGAAAVEAIAREHVATSAAQDERADLLRRLCRERSRTGLDDLAERIDPVATWEDLVLPAAHLALLHEIARHVRHRTHVHERWGFGQRSSRGLGVAALFAGESGTGKTLAAEVLAHDLELDLYRIDLSAAVSKYIGETEKNLRRLFDAAETSGAVLLFDEADALFGKRGEVKDAHDRYANLEVAYLLARMESYRGLAILTTNMRANVDRAFLRRLRFVVQFPFPDVAEREAMWRRAFPPAAPLDGIDPTRLAQLAVPGGTIRSIALGAAFAAAHAATPITPAHLLHAARVEYAKSERSLAEGEATWLT